jgi:O-antigen biosynthesis protein
MVHRVSAEEASYTPRAILEIELEDLSFRWKGEEGTLQRERALVLVRLHSHPIGVMDVSLSGQDMGHVFDEASEQFSTEIAQHRNQDEALTTLDEHGVSNSCVANRNDFRNGAPSVSVVLATKNRPVLAKRCLESIYQSEYPNFDVVVVDSSDGDETETLIKEKFGDAHYVRNRAGRVCVAKSRGAEAAQGHYLAFTDDDAEVDRHWVAELVLALESSPEVACATGFVMPLELETRAQGLFEESGAFVEGLRPRRISLAERQPGSLLPYATGRIGAGVNMAWRNDVLTQLGYFDIALDACGAEDLAVFFDALCAGYEIVYQPGAIVWHQHRRTMDELRAQTLWHSTGLGAYLTRCLVKEPQRVWDLAKRIPGGLRYGFAARSVRNRKKSESFPRDVTRQEWIGFMKGPAAYVKGAAAVRRTESKSEHLND